MHCVASRQAGWFQLAMCLAASLPLTGGSLWSAESEPRSGIRPVDASGKPLNLDFETGTLKDWQLEGDAFVGQPVEGDTVVLRRGERSQHTGRFWIGGFEKQGDGPQGTLTSVAFKVTQPWATFLIAGGSHATTRVEIVDDKTGAAIFESSGDESEALKPVLVDLREHAGAMIKIRVVDQHSAGWGHINFDDFRFHESKPDLPKRPAPLTADQYAHSGLSPQEAAEAMQVPPGFKVTLFAGEPDVQQPIAMALDDRGRLWIAEAYSYPVKVPD